MRSKIKVSSERPDYQRERIRKEVSTPAARDGLLPRLGRVVRDFSNQ